MSLSAGDHLGPYTILGPLGSGGMGEVYRAHDPRLGRDVALKILPQLFAQDADRLARFQREAQVLASLNHSNIGGIHGVEDAPSASPGQAPVRALVLELVEGPTLADRIVQGPIPLDEALGIARQIADALEAAHEHGIIHRDLKPANIKLRPDGTVKVLDFGLAKPSDATSSMSGLSMSPTITSPAMTQMGVILGTAAYMSPEQAKGKPVDKRADVWAFGCVLYEMLTGQRAFGSDEIADVLAFIITKEPYWKALPDATPAAIRKLLRRCLEKDRKKRLADISDARLEMDDAPEESGVPGATSTAQLTATSRSIWKRAMPPITVAVVAGLIAGAAVWKFRTPDRPKLLRFSYTLPEGQQFTNVARQQIAISPDAQQLVYVANRQLHLRIMSELEGRPIPGSGSPQGISGPSFSPDGSSVVFFANGDQA